MKPFSVSILLVSLHQTFASTKLKYLNVDITGNYKTQAFHCTGLKLYKLLLCGEKTVEKQEE
jgi:hypothetical protein